MRIVENNLEFKQDPQLARRLWCGLGSWLARGKWKKMRTGLAVVDVQGAAEAWLRSCGAAELQSCRAA
jgi:hypothetical protein